MEAMTGLYTKTQYDMLPEGFPAQLVEGCLVREPSPPFGHQRVALAIAEALKRVVGPLRVAMAPLDVPVDDFNVFQPDVVVFREAVDDDASPADRGPPLLVVEVLSPSTASRDRTVKRVRLLDLGVDEVWLVDPGLRVVEVYDRGRYADVPRRASGTPAIDSHALAGFGLSPAALFAR